MSVSHKFDPQTLLLDGLDECQDQGTQLEILCLIASAVQGHPRTFRFLIASRPEVHIRNTFQEPFFFGIFRSLNVEQSFEDIWTYFRDEFARIRREHRDTMGNVPSPWPSLDVLDNLVENSSGYFVYASTVIKFIDDKYSRPTHQLAAILDLPRSDSNTPFTSLDQLYIQILTGVPARFHTRLGDILHCVIIRLSDYPTPVLIDRLLMLQPGDTQLILRGLHSLLEVPSAEESISVHHASFLDFLQDQQRSSIFHVNQENRINVARAVLKALSDENQWLNEAKHPLAWYVN
jgi:hypothetical protein